MGEALYRKYRPKSLDDVVGQPHITETLSNALKKGKVSHGYLFSGPRGVGKTSIARILAHQVNDFEYGDPQGALDIIEIDAASNRRIDEIRDLRDKVHIAPVSGKYKVYIIDEVHMLTREAFNALLKTLEEPPAHVIFILATTEAHKLPETIVSRTQRYSFKPVPQDEVVKHLQTLAKNEGISITDEALQLIARHGEGSFRDSISLLDQLSTLKKVEADDIQRILGIPSDSLLTNIIDSLKAGDIKNLVEQLDEAQTHSFSAPQISSGIIERLRSSLIEGTEGREIVPLMEQLLRVPTSSNPGQYLELVLVDFALQTQPRELKKSPDTVKTSTRADKKSETEKVKPKPPEPKPSLKEEKPSAIKTAVSDTDLIALVDNGLWDKVLAKLKLKYNTLYGLARMAQPSVEENELVLAVPFAFHQKRLNEEKNSIIIHATLVEITGGPIVIRTKVDANAKATTREKKTPTPKTPSSDTIETVTQIFGGGEVLES